MVFSFRGVNWKVVSLVIGLSLFGVVMVYSASSFNADRLYSDSFFFVKKQIVGVVLGSGAMLLVSMFDYHKLLRFRFVALIVGFVLLIMVFVPVIGVESYGAKRWINFGILSFQASEIAKFCLIIFAAGYMVKHRERMSSFLGSLPVLLAGGGMCVLIMLEPNMSITICVGVLLLSLLLFGGMRLKHLCLVILPSLCLLPALIILEPYRVKRLLAFINPWASPQGEGFQLIQSLYSLGNGGWFGVGLFNSRQKYSFLPFSESDFIFSIIGEELGFVGALCVLFVFVVLIFYCIKVAMHAPDRLGFLLSIGVATILATQVLLNVAVVSGAVPPTGLPLPFISAGSTSLVVFMSAMGIVLNIDKQSKDL